MIPGEIMTAAGDLVLNEGREAVTLDGRQYRRPPDPGRLPLPLLRDQRGPALRPRGRAACGSTSRPARPCASSRARPRDVELIPLAGSRVVYGFRQDVMGRLGRPRMALHDLALAYADMFGPTTGDRVRLADTDLVIEVERDFTIYGEEVKFGGGKVIRDGMGQSQARAPTAPSTRSSPMRSSSTTGASSRPISASRTAASPAIGKAGNPDIQPGVDIVDRPGHRSDRRRGQDPHRRRHRLAHPLHLSAAGRRSADVGHHDHARRRHRPREGTWRPPARPDPGTWS